MKGGPLKIFSLFVDIFHRLSELPQEIFPLWIYLIDI